MARAKRHLAGGEAVLKPTPERWQRGEVERLPRAIADDSGRPARPYRAPDTLLLMERRGSISAPMRQAAEDFRAVFHAAVLDPLATADLHRLPNNHRELQLTERQAHARKQVWSALGALGGFASPAGSCVWHVVGAEWTLKEWALREGWGGRPISPETATGILVGALGVLQAYYGL